MTEQDLINIIRNKQNDFLDKKITEVEYKEFHKEMDQQLQDYKSDDAKVFYAEYQLKYGLREMYYKRQGE